MCVSIIPTDQPPNSPFPYPPSTPHNQVSGGVWSLMRKFFYQPAQLSKWSVVSFCSKRRLDPSDVDKYIEGLMDALSKTGAVMMSDRLGRLGRLVECVCDVCGGVSARPLSPANRQPPTPHHQPTQTNTKTNNHPGVRCPRPAAVIYAEDERDTVSNCLRKALQPGQVELVVCCIEKEVRMRVFLVGFVVAWGDLGVFGLCVHPPRPSKRPRPRPTDDACPNPLSIRCRSTRR